MYEYAENNVKFFKEDSLENIYDNKSLNEYFQNCN